MKAFEDYIQLAGTDGSPRSGMILGIRMALLGLRELSLSNSTDYNRKLVVFVETDRCLPDAIELVTECRMGNRTLKFCDMGKMAATFMDLRTKRAIRLAAMESANHRAQDMFPHLAKEDALQAGYRAFPDDALFSKRAVRLTLSQEDVPGYRAPRVVCAECGEGIAFGREITKGERVVCRSCAGQGYWEPL